MSGSPAPVTRSAPTPVCVRNPALLIGGYFSLGFAVFQASAIWWPANAIKYFGGPVELSLQRPLIYVGLCLVVAILVGGFGLYALSGAGQIRRLPLLRTGLITVTAIYLLRGMLALPQVPIVLRHPDLFRFLIFSLISLAVGIIHACGVISFYRQPPIGE